MRRQTQLPPVPQGALKEKAALESTVQALTAAPAAASVDDEVEEGATPTAASDLRAQLATVTASLATVTRLIHSSADVRPAISNRCGCS